MEINAHARHQHTYTRTYERTARAVRKGSGTRGEKGERTHTCVRVHVLLRAVTAFLPFAQLRETLRPTPFRVTLRMGNATKAKYIFPGVVNWRYKECFAFWGDEGGIHTHTEVVM